jgi:RHS repeat-associated protein
VSRPIPTGCCTCGPDTYDPAIRRFINQDVLFGSIDPGISLDRFAFANGDPVHLLDPAGTTPQSITIQSFIADPSATTPWFDVAGSVSPDSTFRGDNRGFLQSPVPFGQYEGNTYRTTSTITFDPQDPAFGSLTADTGITHAIDIFAQQYEAKADASGFSGSVEYNETSGLTTVTLQGRAANPLVNFSPPIQYSLVIQIDPTGAYTAQFNHTAFPSFQIFHDDDPLFNYLEQGDGMNLFSQTQDSFGGILSNKPNATPGCQ